MKLEHGAGQRRVTLRSGVWGELKKTALTLVHQLAMSVQKRWRQLRGFRHLAEVIADVRFVDGMNEKETGGSAA